MILFRTFLCCCLAITLSMFAQTKPAAPGRKDAARPTHPLVWDAMELRIKANRGDSLAEFQFAVTNASDRPIQIFEIRTSCGCTIAEMPKTPWILEPAGKGSFRATVDIRGRHGHFSKTLMVVSAAGPQVLGVVVEIPEPPVLSRDENRDLAVGDRQAVFHGTCYTCHVEPIGGKQGALLFQAACTICHEAEPRASMVPDLMMPKEKRDANFWRTWIRDGREKTLMPGFAYAHDGPLSDDQIESLVDYAMKNLPTEPAKN